MAEKRVTATVTTGVGILSFPRVFKDTKGKNDRGDDVYDVQILLPKSDRVNIRKVLAALKTVGEAKWGEDRWKKVNLPLRDGDKEQDDVTEDGQTKGEKYPERLGCYFINARSQRPVPVVDRKGDPIEDSDAVYGGCRGRLNIEFYPYSNQGNTGIAAGLNGVQKVGDGEPFGSSRPSVESMFDVIDDEDDGLDSEYENYEEPEEIEEEPKRTAKKTAAKKTAAKKTASRRPVPEPDDEDDLEESEDEEDLYDDI